ARLFLPLRRATLAGALTIPLVVWMWPHAHYFSYNQLTILLCVFALRCACEIEVGKRTRGALQFGALLGLALWTKPNLPIALGASVLAYWLATWIHRTKGLPVVRMRTFSDIVRDGLVVGGGIAIVSLLPLGYLAGTGTLDEMVSGAIAITQVYSDSPTGLFPSPFPVLEQIDAVRLSTGLVLPGMLINVFYGIGRDPFYHHLVLFTGAVDLFARLLYYLPVVMYGAIVACISARPEEESENPNDALRRRDTAVLVTCGGLALYASNFSFPAFHYITPTLLPLPALAVYGWDAVRSRWRATFKGAVARGLGIASIAVYLALTLIAVVSYVSVPRQPVKTARGTIHVSAPTAVLWNEMLETTRTLMKPDDEILVVPYFPLFYYMGDYDHPTRHAALGPGLPGMEAVDEIIDHLDRERVAFALHVYGAEYPGLERFENAYPRLIRYLETHYELERRFEGTQRDYADLLRRKSTEQAQ
ncbi:MAG: hypothetical protein QF570_14020, partial [Myxococcota bacterium]|nr:hypothetical protein [Myxococcota bacterium]